MNPDIQIYNFRRIDSKKWNDCVFGSSQGTVFGAYEYLSGMAGNWFGLVVGDYEAVLPLLTRKKWGIRYLAVMPFVRQLGLFGNYVGAAEALFTKIQRFCRYGDIGFNHHNGWLFDAGDAKEDYSKPNYIIDLCPGYGEIQKGYRKSLLKRLRQTASAGLQLVDCCELEASPDNTEEISVAAILCAYREFIRLKMTPGTYQLDKDFARLEDLLHTGFGRRYFHPYGVRGRSGKNLLLGIYARDGQTVHNMMSVCVGTGREENAMGFAVDALIRKYAGQALYFDFMGSSLPGVQEFIHGFGATPAPYFLYHYNRLPWPLKLIKQ